LIRRRIAVMFKKILVPIDGSRYASRAVDAAADLARHQESSIFLLHVIRNMALPKEILAMIRAGEVTQSRMEILEDSAEIILDNAQEKLAQAGVSGTERAYLIGDEASTIADYAEENGIDLIVLGHRGLNPGGDLLGSVARKLLNTTDITCLVVT
jgi:nucleotide-binding universal stress UspA family protein